MTDTTPGTASAARRFEPDPTPLGPHGDAFTADEPDRTVPAAATTPAWSPTSTTFARRRYHCVMGST
jgi:hypothetical protein